MDKRSSYFSSTVFKFVCYLCDKILIIDMHIEIECFCIMCIETILMAFLHSLYLRASEDGVRCFLKESGCKYSIVFIKFEPLMAASRPCCFGFYNYYSNILRSYLKQL